VYQICKRKGVAAKLRGARPSSLVIGGFVAALLVTACGGSSSLSHAQLVAKASAACRQASVTAARLPAPGNSYGALGGYARQLSPIVDGLITELGTLKPNANDRQPLQRYIGALRTGSRGLGLLTGASSPAQLTQATSLLSSQSIQALAGALGAPACAASPAP
jgi:hypothetical protein